MRELRSDKCIRDVFEGRVLLKDAVLCWYREGRSDSEKFDIALRISA